MNMQRLFTLSALVALLAAAFVSTPAAAQQEVELIPRETLFGNPDKVAPRVSPDGTQLSYIAPVDGVLNVWVGPLDGSSDPKPVTSDTGRGIRIHFWAHTNDHIIYLQDKGGDENWRAYVTNVETGETRDLTPMEGVQARIQEVSHRHPKEILVGLNDRDPRFHDIYRVDITTGERELVLKNPGIIDGAVVAGFLTDDRYNVRLATAVTQDGGGKIFKRSAEGDWKTFIAYPPADSLTTNPVGFNKAGDILYMIDSRDRDTAALTSVSLATGERAILAEDDKADAAGVMQHPTEKHIQAVSFPYLRQNWRLLDEELRNDWRYLRALESGDISVVSRSLDDRHWIVSYTQDAGPVRYYVYDRRLAQATFLFPNREALTDAPLAPMQPVIVAARDGLKLVSYLTVPLEHVEHLAKVQRRERMAPDTSPDGPLQPPGGADVDPEIATETLPLVLLVHGGPWGRDTWGYDPTHQWLANRGYAVLSVNFRGSTGFGKEFVNAGDKEWARGMHEDLIDAVNWAIDEEIADPDRVAIMGGSYGGYATLVGLTFTPDVFACGVDIVGPSNLITLLRSVPPYWAAISEMFRTRVGDVSTEAGRKLLRERSPLTYVDRIKSPLLIGQGANDPRVKQAESDQIVSAMQGKNIPVTYVLYPDEGHGFARPENRLSFFAVAEAFLSEHLGGRWEPFGDDFENSSIRVPAGAGEVPGLSGAISETSGE